MKITAIILAHYKQRQDNLNVIIDDLLAGSVTPDEIVVFIDNPEIDFNDERVVVIKSSAKFLPRIRFALGSYFDSDYCLFVDDDLTVKSDTLKNLVKHAKKLGDKAILGFRGSVLADTDNPYADDTSVKQGDHKKPIKVDIVLRTYFVPRKSMSYGLILQSLYPSLPSLSLDDVYLCLGNKYLNKAQNYVIPTGPLSGIRNLPEKGVGQSIFGIHYENRNKVTRYLMDKYEL